MSNEKCSAGHERCPYPDPHRGWSSDEADDWCQLHGLRQTHCIHGTPIGQECKKAPQPEKVEGELVISEMNGYEARLAAESFKESLDSAMDTIRAKDEELEIARTVKEQFQRQAESAGVKVVELEAENERLLDLVKRASVTATWIVNLSGHPTAISENMKWLDDAQTALTPKEAPPEEKS